VDQLVKLIIDEGKWLPFSMALAFAAVAVLFLCHRRSQIASRTLILALMNLFVGTTLLTMSFGHLLAVTTKLSLGLLQGSAPKFYLIGVALIVPSSFVVFHTRRILSPHVDHGSRTVILNAWLAATLIILGIHNLPLAAGALINIGYHLHSRRLVGWAIVSVALLLNIGLFIGAMIFLMSGRSFEEFSGMG
jgi:hypothetical protein